jgi:hypothetical protein
MTVGMELGQRLDFPNLGCGIEEFRKTIFEMPLSDPSFPRLPQAG